LFALDFDRFTQFPVPIDISQFTMKATLAVFAAAATIAQAVATPAQLTARAGSVPVVTVKGNGNANISTHTQVPPC
jgi:hypothetical protein